MTWEPPADMVEKAAAGVLPLLLALGMQGRLAIETSESIASKVLRQAFPDGPEDPAGAYRRGGPGLTALPEDPADAYRRGHVHALREAAWALEAAGAFYRGAKYRATVCAADLLRARADATERETSPTDPGRVD